MTIWSKLALTAAGAAFALGALAGVASADDNAGKLTTTVKCGHIFAPIASPGAHIEPTACTTDQNLGQNSVRPNNGNTNVANLASNLFPWL
ncbi:unnamed protein product [[Actinomadura] parvosata subsp. kistnae]|uniref:Chaplin domain-containing protein n=1 Tax=[Actinomadura] parvosata subsp. kistnae TaxID=1909395 RepID=A0A1V0ACI4_9ACTN|nr:hypothetical protein [Nonomuraea sp. ATCC 55076]AQZ67842.1 hypothetical protein BKM31_45980 [Nonomuraea sp. ATCC 55076]SPL93832.1 unnamed protein product [Actinomadura parvosata subsp. kistnae]